MAYEPRDLSGTLFKGDKTAANPNWPDYKGDCLIDGKAYWISAWVKDGAKGKFMSLAFKVKEAKGGGGSSPKLPENPKAAGRQSDGFEDSEIPFLSRDGIW